MLHKAHLGRLYIVLVVYRGAYLWFGTWAFHPQSYCTYHQSTLFVTHHSSRFDYLVNFSPTVYLQCIIGKRSVNSLKLLKTVPVNHKETLLASSLCPMFNHERQENFQSKCSKILPSHKIPKSVPCHTTKKTRTSFSVA